MNIKSAANGWMNLARKHLNISNEDTEKTAVWRYSKCLQCDQQNKTTLLCNLCGCYTPAKVRDEESKCPVGKW